MLNQIFMPFNRIGFKLFLGFWIIAIVSITATHFISAQLRQESIILPPIPHEFTRLQRIKALVNANPLMSPQDLIHLPTHSRGTSVILKRTSDNQTFTPRKRFTFHLQDYIEKNSFTTLTTIQFPYARITGPLPVVLNRQNYQLYLASKGQPPHFNSFILQLPAWVRIIIPLVVSMLLSWWLARSLSNPIKAMQKAAAEFGDGNLSSRVAKPYIRKDELGELANSFNQMAMKLEKNISAHQRLLGDVSHELRSPMTRLQIAIGLAQKSHEDEKVLHNYLARCEKEVTQLDDMIANVLTLSRLENTIHHCNKAQTDVYQLIKQNIDDSQFIGQEKNIIIEAELPKPLIASVDDQLLSSAISNILLNAIKYSPEYTVVRIVVTFSQEQLIIAITDQGAGVPESALSQLFEPFYRVADARDRDTGGTGLGLAITKQAILAHKGTIEAKNNLGNGLTITITLPI